VVYKTTALPLS